MTRRGIHDQQVQLGTRAPPCLSPLKERPGHAPSPSSSPFLNPCCYNTWHTQSPPQGPQRLLLWPVASTLDARAPCGSPPSTPQWGMEDTGTLSRATVVAGVTLPQLGPPASRQTIAGCHRGQPAWSHGQVCDHPGMLPTPPSPTQGSVPTAQQGGL